MSDTSRIQLIHGSLNIAILVALGEVYQVSIRTETRMFFVSMNELSLSRGHGMRFDYQVVAYLALSHMPDVLITKAWGFVWAREDGILQVQIPRSLKKTTGQKIVHSGIGCRGIQKNETI